ncbi:MAG: LysM peptidoglycan-binding domain-containing protein [Thermodesulfobacteriota bacterium]
MKADRNRKGTLCLITLTVMAIRLGTFTPDVHAGTDQQFPSYPSLRDAVSFWKKVYSQYSTRQGIIHDNRKMNIIYEIVDLEDPNRGGSDRANQARIKAAKNKYLKILSDLANGKQAASRDEKRVLAFFGKNPDRKTFKAAQERVRFQLGQQDRFREGLIRSGRYLGEIKRIFREYGLPEELAYLPHVESSFNYKAYSKFGAAGIWQFTHSTGRRYMTINYVQDDRRDPIRATHAAATYLKQNHRRLGSWPLALTAYNHGENGMARAKQAFGGDFERIVREYESPSFGFASRNFYAEFLAALEVAKNYRKYFGDLSLEAPVQFEEVVLPGYASIKGLADHFKTDVQSLRELNFSLREPVFLGQKYVPKGYRLRVPKKEGLNVIELAARMPGAIISPKQLPTRFYRVRKGDTAGGIARAHGVTLAQLISANGLSSSAKIYVGQNLRMPLPSEQPVLLASLAKKIPDAQKPAATEPVRETPPPVKAEPAKPRAAVAEKTPPQAPPRETSSPKEASAPAVQPKPGGVEVQAEQQTTRKELFPEEVHVPLEATATAAPGGNGSPAANIPAEGNGSPLSESEVNPAVVVGDFQIEKVVKKGSRTVGTIKIEAEETLGHYADWLDVPTQTIRRLNNFGFNTPIQIDQRIQIPIAKISKEEFETKRYEYHKEMEEDFFSVYRISGVTTYMVKTGDNIWSLCDKEFEIPFWLLRKYNTARDFNALQPGDKLRVPLVTKIGNGNG